MSTRAGARLHWTCSLWCCKSSRSRWCRSGQRWCARGPAGSRRRCLVGRGGPHMLPTTAVSGPAWIAARMAAAASSSCCAAPQLLPPPTLPPRQVFLPLVTRLVNDPSSKCRAMVGAALGVLLRRAAPPRRDRLAQFCAQWLGGGDARLNRAAAQVRGGACPAGGGCVPAIAPRNRLAWHAGP